MSADTPTLKERPGFLGFFENYLELVIAILLGVVSIVTAYASFQGALYGGMQSSEYQKGGSLSTEAESLYLEGNQQFMQDTQVYSPLDDEHYQDSLFASYAETSKNAGVAVAKGDVVNLEGGKLTLYTVLMSISLFLLGIAALMRKFTVQVVLLASGLGIFAVSAVLTAAVPFVSL